MRLRTCVLISENPQSDVDDAYIYPIRRSATSGGPNVSPDWLMTRMVAVAFAVLGPLYFLLLVAVLPFQMAPFGDPLLDWLFHYVATPAVFSAAWVGIIYYERYRIANAVHLTGETTTAIPLRWRVFYGTNAAFVLTFFILPLITAPLAVIAGLFVAGHVFYRIGIGKLGGGKPAAFLGAVVAIALCVLPLIVMIQFVPSYLQVWDAVLGAWSGFWFSAVYGIAQCLVNALSFGAPIYFVYFAATQYDKGLYGETYTRTPTVWIRIGEIALFLVFTVLYLPPILTPFGLLPFANMSWLFTDYINWMSLFIVVLMVAVKARLKVKDSSTMGGPSNVLVVGLFLLVEIFFKTDLLVVTLVIWLAFLIFAGVIAISFARASPREMY